MGKLTVSLVHYYTNATRTGWHLWDIDLRFAPGLPPGWGTRTRTPPRTCTRPRGQPWGPHTPTHVWGRVLETPQIRSRADTY